MGFSLLTQQIPSHVNLVVPPLGNDKVFCAYALTELSHDIIYLLHIPPTYTAYLLYVRRL